MGRILFETDSATYELERSDEDVLKYFETLTGVKVALRRPNEILQEPEIKTLAPSEKPFTHEALPSKEELIEYVKNHLDGYSVSTSLEHFFGYTPRYGVSKEQNRIIGTFSARLLRARETVEKSEGGKFESVQRGAVKLFVFKKNTTDAHDEENASEPQMSEQTINEEITPQMNEVEKPAKSIFEF